MHTCAGALTAEGTCGDQRSTLSVYLCCSHLISMRGGGGGDQGFSGNLGLTGSDRQTSQ